jgi:hypothetical protein
MIIQVAAANPRWRQPRPKSPKLRRPEFGAQYIDASGQHCSVFQTLLHCVQTNVVVSLHANEPCSPRGVFALMMRPQNLTDKSLIALYESLRKQTNMAANGAGLRSHVIGQNTRDYAERLRAEMERRQLQFTPIEWSTPR